MIHSDINKKMPSISVVLILLMILNGFLSIGTMMHGNVATYPIPSVRAISDEESYIISQCNSSLYWYTPSYGSISVIPESEEGGSAIKYSMISSSFWGDAGFGYDPPGVWNWSSLSRFSVSLCYNVTGTVRVIIFDSKGNYRHWDFSLDVNVWTKKVFILPLNDYTADNGLDLSKIDRIQFGCQEIKRYRVHLLVKNLLIEKAPEFNLYVKVADYIGFPVSNHKVMLFFEDRLISSQITNSSGWVNILHVPKGIYVVKTSFLWLESQNEFVVDSTKPVFVAVPLLFVTLAIVLVGIAGLFLIYKKRNYLIKTKYKTKYFLALFFLCYLIVGGSLLTGRSLLSETTSVFLFFYLIVLIVIGFITFKEGSQKE